MAVKTGVRRAGIPDLQFARALGVGIQRASRVETHSSCRQAPFEGIEDSMLM